MSTIDQQFVEYIIKNLVSNPDDVSIERKIDEKGVLLTLTVNPEDLGRIIGRRGSTAQSIRTLLRALGTKNEAHYNLKIVNNDEDENGSRISKKAPVAESADFSQEEAATVEETVENVEDITKSTREELAQLDDLDI